MRPIEPTMLRKIRCKQWKNNALKKLVKPVSGLSFRFYKTFRLLSKPQLRRLLPYLKLANFPMPQWNYEPFRQMYIYLYICASFSCGAKVKKKHRTAQSNFQTIENAYEILQPAEWLKEERGQWLCWWTSLAFQFEPHENREPVDNFAVVMHNSKTVAFMVKRHITRKTLGYAWWSLLEDYWLWVSYVTTWDSGGQEEVVTRAALVLFDWDNKGHDFVFSMRDSLHDIDQVAETCHKRTYAKKRLI